MKKARKKRPPISEIHEEAGRYLNIIREGKGLTLEQVSKKIDTSIQFLSEIENGVKNPGDEVLRRLANLYDIPEHILFEKFGRTPLGILEELEKNESLKQLLTEIRYSKILNDEEKQEVTEKVLDYFQELVSEVKERKKQLDDHHQ